MVRDRFSRRDFSALLLGLAGLPFAYSAGGIDEAFADNQVRTYVDDLDRSVNLPSAVNSVAALGVNAQTLLVQLCPDNLVSLTKVADSSDSLDFEAAGVSDSVVQLGTGVLNSSDIDKVEPDVCRFLYPDLMVDAGLNREGLAEELDELQSATGIPCVFLDLSFGSLADAYRKLGAIFDCGVRAELLACQTESIQADTENCIYDLLGAFPSAVYAPRARGIDVSSSIKVQLDALEHVGAKVVYDAYDFQHHTIDFDALDRTPPEVIVFDDLSSEGQMASRQGEIADTWQEVVDKYCIRTIMAPARMHSWFRSMVFVQSIGLLWLRHVFALSHDDGVFRNEVDQFYELYFGYCPSEVE